MATRDAAVVAAMRELAGQYPRDGYRKIRICLAARARDEPGPCPPPLAPGRAPGAAAPAAATGGTLAPRAGATDGAGLKCLTIVDEFTRECLEIDVAGSIRSRRVIEV